MKKILSVVLSVVMILGIYPMIAFAEERNDYDCVDGYEHTTNNGQCGNCSAFIVEEGATMRLKITLVGLYSTSWALVEGNAIIIDSGSSSFSNFSSGYFETYPWVTIKGEKAGTDVLLLFANDSLYTTGQIVVIPHQTHISFETINGIWATCTESGLTDGLKCTYCGEVAVEQEEIPATGHTGEVIPAKSATCTEIGLTEGKKCSVCGEILVAQEEIPAKGHSYTAVVTTPTCIEQGYTTYICACGDFYINDYTEIVEHSYEKVVITPTCTQQGYTIYTCVVCGDSYINDYTEIVEHSYERVVIAPTCTQQGYTIYTCVVCGDSYKDNYVEVIPHTEEIIPGKDSTCTATGLTEEKRCSVCGEILVAQEEIPATGQHIFNEWEIMVNPTCESEGEQHRWCTICSILEKDLLPATGHASGEWEVVISAQVGIEGKEQQNCTVCDKVLDERSIPALPDDTFTPGDVNGDGKVNAADARIILRISAQLEKIDKYSQPFEAFDVNGDGKINASDARKVLRISAKLES